MKLAALAGGERSEEVGLGRPRCLRRARQGRQAAGRQLDSMASPIRRVRRTIDETGTLKLVEQRDDVRWLDPKRGGKFALGEWTLGLEMVKRRVLGPPEATLREAAAEAPRRGTG